LSQAGKNNGPPIENGRPGEELNLSAQTDNIAARGNEASTKPRKQRFTPWYETNAFLEKFKEWCEWNNQQWEEWSVNHATNTYRSCTYWLVKRLKACPEFEGLPENTVIQILDMACRKLAPKNHPDPWSYLLPGSDMYGAETDPRTEALIGLRKLKVPEAPGMDCLEIAWRKACSRPLALPDPGANLRVRAIMTLAVHLQQASLTGFIVLPQERIAQLAGVSQELISKILRNAVDEGWLHSHRKYPPKAQRANEYVCNLFRQESGVC
jgi:hypothetical protein